MFPFGAQYLRGATPEREDWDKDLKLARSLGFNTLRAWLCWGYLESQPGRIDFDYLDSFLNLVGKHGLKVVLLFNLYGCPEWAAQKYRHCWYVSADGLPLEPSAASSIPTGGWPGLCFDHEEVRRIAEDFMIGVLEHLKDRPEISHWEPMNEPILDPQRYSNKMYCYCPATRAKFIAWLQRKYGSLEELKKAWGRLHGSRNEVRPPTYRVGYCDWIDWRSFLMERVADEVRWRTQVIKSVDSRPVMAHTYEAMPVCDFVTKAYDDWKTAQPVDKWGLSHFPVNGERSTIIGLETDVARNAAAGKEFWQSELRGGNWGGGLASEGLPAAEEFAIWTWESIAHGAKGVLYWQFRNERHGSECGNMGLCNDDGKPTVTAHTASRICRILNENADLFNKVRYPQPEVAILFSRLSYFVNWCAEQNVNLSMDSFTGYYRIFWEASIPVDILHEDHVDLEGMSRYKFLVLPFPVCLSPSIVGLLPKYVESGGTVLSDPCPCRFDHRQWLSRVTPGEGLTRLFGCQEESVLSNWKPEVTFENGTRLIFSKTHFAERFVDVKAKTLAHYSDGGPAIVSHVFGKGSAILSGVNLGLMCTPPRLWSEEAVSKDVLAVSRFVLDLVQKAGVNQKVCLDQTEVTANLLTAENEGVLIVLNHSNESKKCKLTIQGRMQDFYDLETGKRIESAQRDRKTSLSLDLPAMGVKVCQFVLG